MRETSWPLAAAAVAAQEDTKNLKIIVFISTCTFLVATFLLNAIKLAYVVSAMMSFYTLYLYRRVSSLLYMDAQTAEIRGRLQVWLAANCNVNFSGGENTP